MMKRMNLGVCLALGIFFQLMISCSDGGGEFVPVESEYEIDGSLYNISNKIFFVKGAKGEPDQLRLEQMIPGQTGPDVIVFLPVPGPGQFEGNYLFSKTGDIGTYNMVYIKNRQEDAFDWLTNGNGGANLKLVYEGKFEGQEIYTLTLEQFDLNFGNWDFIAGKWNSEGSLDFRFQYQGVIMDKP